MHRLNKPMPPSAYDFLNFTSIPPQQSLSDVSRFIFTLCAIPQARTSPLLSQQRARNRFEWKSRVKSGLTAARVEGRYTRTRLGGPCASAEIPNGFVHCLSSVRLVTGPVPPLRIPLASRPHSLSIRHSGLTAADSAAANRTLSIAAKSPQKVASVKICKPNEGKWLYNERAQKFAQSPHLSR